MTKTPVLTSDAAAKGQIIARAKAGSDAGGAEARFDAAIFQAAGDAVGRKKYGIRGDEPAPPTRKEEPVDLNAGRGQTTYRDVRRTTSKSGTMHDSGEQRGDTSTSWADLCISAMLNATQEQVLCQSGALNSASIKEPGPRARSNVDHMFNHSLASGGRTSECQPKLFDGTQAASCAGMFSMNVVKQETHLPVHVAASSTHYDLRSWTPTDGRDQRGQTRPVALLHSSAGPDQWMRDATIPLRSDPPKSERLDVSGMPASPGAQILQAIALETGSAGAAAIDSPAYAEYPQLAAANAGPIKVIHLQLSPVSLGMIRIELASDESSLRIRINAEQLETAATLDREQALLADRLSAAGYRVDELVVVTSTASEGALGRSEEPVVELGRPSHGAADTRGGGFYSERHASDPDRDDEKSDPATRTEISSASGQLAATSIDRFLGRRWFGSV